MSQAPIPAGYHDADSAAKLLNISKRDLLKRLRELGWLNVGGDAHNLPRHELKHAGWLSTQDRAHCLKGKKEIVKPYQVMLLSQTGFQELKKIIMNQATTTEAPKINMPEVPIKPAVKMAPVLKIESAIEKPFDRNASEIERQHCLQQLADWGLPIAAGLK